MKLSEYPNLKSLLKQLKWVGGRASVMIGIPLIVLFLSSSLVLILSMTMLAIDEGVDGTTIFLLIIFLGLAIGCIYSLVTIRKNTRYATRS